MFRCNQCHTEYGGIRGISADSCPRCAAQAGVPAFSVTRADDLPRREPALSAATAPQPVPLYGSLSRH